MKRFQVGHAAPYGLYVSRRPLAVHFVGADGEALEGKPGASFVRLPTWMIAVLAPALGGAFVMLFPLLVIAAVFAAVATLVSRKFASSHAYVTRVGWEPSAAYFKKDHTKGEAETETPAADPALDALEAEVAARAAAEKKQEPTAP